MKVGEPQNIFSKATTSENMQDESAVPIFELRSASKTTTAAEKNAIPAAVIRRLPIYYRHLRQLLKEDVLRISSSELARKMHINASQIRSDLSFFGEFGQQGYGYNVKFLFKSISEIIGATKSFRAVMITNAMPMSNDIALSVLFERGIVFDAFFLTEFSENTANAENRYQPESTSFNHGEPVKIMPISQIREFCLDNEIDIIIVHSAGNRCKFLKEALNDIKCCGIWNISGYDLSLDRSDIPIENIYICDSFLSLCHSIKINKEKNQQNEDRIDV